MYVDATYVLLYTCLHMHTYVLQSGNMISVIENLETLKSLQVCFEWLTVPVHCMLCTVHCMSYTVRTYIACRTFAQTSTYHGMYVHAY